MIKEYLFPDNLNLFITDSLQEFETLKAKGEAVVPVLTDENRSFSWPHSEYILENPDDIDEAYLYRIALRMNNLPWTIAETERLLIREMTLEDVPHFYRIYEDSSVTEYMEPLYENPEDELTYTRDYIRQIYHFYEYGIWTIVEKSSGSVIGRAGIDPQKESGLPDLGFVIEKSKRHLGYALEACRAILRYSKNELGLSKIQARVNPNNFPSVSLLKKLGFSDSYEKSDDLCIFILEE